MDRISQGHLRGLEAQLARLGKDGGGDDRFDLRGLDERSVAELRAAIDEGRADQTQVERRLVEVGRVGDVYEVAKGRGAADEASEDDGKPGEKGHGHDKKVAEALLTSFVYSTLEAVRQDLNASAEQIAQENRERDVVGTRVVGDRLVFDTASGPAHSISLSSAELARMERDGAQPVSGARDN